MDLYPAPISQCHQVPKEGRDRKKRSGFSPSKKIPEAPTLQFIIKLVHRWKAFIFNTSPTKIFHSKLKRRMGPNCLWRVVVLPATLAATAMATSRSLRM